MPAYYLEALTVTLGLVLLMVEAFVPTKNKAWVGLGAAAGLGVILLVAFPLAIGPEAIPDAGWASWPLWQFQQFDSLARFFKILALVTTILVILMSVDYRSILARYTEKPGSEDNTGEFYVLPVFACAGMMWLASATHLVGAFVALELITITFYILVAYKRRNVGSLVAGVKYLILGALSTGFLVYGIAWIYGACGGMHPDDIRAAAASVENPAALLFGTALMLVGIGFKVGAVPMQIWIPDVYQGAPTPTTAFLSVGSKAAGCIFLIRFLEPLLAPGSLVASQVVFMLAIIAGATLLVGNLGAIPQTNFKRMLAYSSIANAGFIVMALAAWHPAGIASQSSAQVAGFYLATYLLMTLGVFFILCQVRIQRDGEAVTDFNGLGKTNPVLASALTVLLAALAGLPLTAGFIGKFLVFSLAVDSGMWVVIVIAFIGTAAGFYYYLNVVRAMWWVESGETTGIKLPAISTVCITAMVAATLVFGVWPQPILSMLR